MSSLVFFGSSQFSVTVLQKILSAQCSVLSVVTTPDKPAGRGLKLTPNPVKLFAQKHEIPVYIDIHDFLPVDIPSNTIGLVAAHGRRLGPKTLSKFKTQVYVIHPSLLPKYRGPSPLQQQILDGITQTGVTLIQADLGEDTGPIIAQGKDVILPNDTWITLGNRLFEKGANLFLNTPLFLPPKLGGRTKVRSTPQDDSLATYTKKLTRQDGFLPWEQFVKFDYDRKFRAYFNWPEVWSISPSGHRVKLISLNPVTVQYAGQKPTSHVK